MPELLKFIGEVRSIDVGSDDDEHDEILLILKPPHPLICLMAMWNGDVTESDEIELRFKGKKDQFKLRDKVLIEMTNLGPGEKEGII